MYMHKIQKAGDYVLIKNYTPIGSGAGRKRKREHPTTESRKKMNDKKRAEKIQLLILRTSIRRSSLRKQTRTLQSFCTE